MEKVKIPHKAKVIEILKRHNIEYAALFGSRAKKFSRQDSDYDILVQYAHGEGGGLFALAGMIADLETEVGAKVDIVSNKFIHPLLKREILLTAKVFYDTRER